MNLLLHNINIMLILFTYVIQYSNHKKIGIITYVNNNICHIVLS